MLTSASSVCQEDSEAQLWATREAEQARSEAWLC